MLFEPELGRRIFNHGLSIFAFRIFKYIFFASGFRFWFHETLFNDGALFHSDVGSTEPFPIFKMAVGMQQVDVVRTWVGTSVFRFSHGFSNTVSVFGFRIFDYGFSVLGFRFWFHGTLSNYGFFDVGFSQWLQQVGVVRTWIGASVFRLKRSALP